MRVPIRIKTYDKRGVIHGRFDMTIEDISDIQRIVEDIDEILRNEFNDIEGEEDYDSIDD